MQGTSLSLFCSTRDSSFQGFIEKSFIAKLHNCHCVVQEQTIKAIRHLHPHDANYSQYPTVCSCLAHPFHPSLQNVLRVGSVHCITEKCPMFGDIPGIASCLPAPGTMQYWASMAAGKIGREINQSHLGAPCWFQRIGNSIGMHGFSSFL